MRMQWNVGTPIINVDVIAPDYDPNAPWKEKYDNRELDLLFLLHGARGSSSDWGRYSMLETYARDHGIVIVCPSAENSFYINWENSIKWNDAIMIDLWDMVHRYLPVTDKREGCSVAGLSMGGYGAMRFFCDYPERFANVASFSGALDIPNRYAERGNMSSLPNMEHIFGDPSKVIGSKLDLYSEVQRIADSGIELPRMWISCGIRDCFDLYEPAVKMAASLKSLGYDVTFEDGDYDHEWRFWTQQVEKFLNYIDRDQNKKYVM